MNLFTSTRLGGALLLATLATSSHIAQAKPKAQPIKLVSATLARGFTETGPGKPLKPVGATSTFRPTDHKVVTLFTLAKPVNGMARTVMYAVKVPGYAPSERLIEIKTSPSPRLQFGDIAFTNNVNWPRGQFKVALYVNQTLLKNLYFSVK